MSNCANYAGARARTYERALKLERNREFHYRETPQGKFESEKLSLDMLPADSTLEKYESWITDHGTGAEATRAFDEEDALNYYLRKQRAALRRVKRKLPECLKTLKGIFKNGSNREETICELAQGQG